MGYHQLTEKQRYQIELFLALGKSKREIADLIGRHRSTIYREVKRNSLELANKKMIYDAEPAAAIARERRVEACESRYKVKGCVEQYFIEKLDCDWSPEQIAGRYNLEAGHQMVSRSSIYRFIERDRNDFMGHGYFRRLRFYLAKRQRSAGRPLRPVKGIKRSIRERPKACEERVECGHFERDLMEGRRGKKAVLVVTDRKARKVFLRLVKRESRVVQKATEKILKTAPALSMTNDNGHEFLPGQINQAEQRLGTKIYYCDPNSPWQRGTVENSIGLLRQYMPKRRDLSHVTAKQLQKIENLLNDRPRKILNFKTPSEIYFSEKKRA